MVYYCILYQTVSRIQEKKDIVKYRVVRRSWKTGRLEAKGTSGTQMWWMAGEQDRLEGTEGGIWKKELVLLQLLSSKTLKEKRTKWSRKKKERKRITYNIWTYLEFSCALSIYSIHTRGQQLVSLWSTKHVTYGGMSDKRQNALTRHAARITYQINVGNFLLQCRYVIILISVGLTKLNKTFRLVCECGFVNVKNCI